MIRFYVTETGEEVFVGKPISLTTNSFGEASTEIPLILTSFMASLLVNIGILTMKQEDDKKDSKINLNLEYYAESIAKRFGIQPSLWKATLNLIHQINPQAAFSILLREIAVELDKKYVNHIQDSSKIYVIATINGKITEVNKATIKNYRNFAAFRTIEDAKIACGITKNLLRELYRNDNRKQKN